MAVLAAALLVIDMWRGRNSKGFMEQVQVGSLVFAFEQGVFKTLSRM
jgi:hypothetical protein